jgi:hypothetical protein
MPDVAKASNRRSLLHHVPNPEYPQVKANRKASFASAQYTYQTPVYRSLHDSNMGNDELRWTVKREKARSQRKSAATVQEYPRQLLQNVVQDSSYPAIPRKVAHSTSRSSLRSCSSHQRLLINSHSLTGLSSSSSSSRNLDLRFNLGALGSHPEAWLYEPQSAERSISDINLHLTPHNTAVRTSRSGPSSSSPSMSNASSPIPVASLRSMQRYYPMLPQHFGSGSRLITKSLIRPISTASISSMPSVRLDHFEPSQMQRKSLSRAAQQQHESDVQRARSESLAALTAVHPESYLHQRASPPSLNEPHQASTLSSQHHVASLRHSSHSNSGLRPPPQTMPVLSYIPDQTTPYCHVTPSSRYRTVPRRESLAQWKAEGEQARSIPDGMRRADNKERVRRANDIELERGGALMEKTKKSGKTRLQNERGCLSGAMR